MGVVGAFEVGDELIGTIRLIPMAQGLAGCDTLLRELHNPLPPAAQLHGWEVGRLVLTPQCRSGPELLKRCLFLTSLYLAHNVTIANLFASCTPLLARLYRRFGFQVARGHESTHDSHDFLLIHGPFPHVLRTLAATAEEMAAAEHGLALIADDFRCAA